MLNTATCPRVREDINDCLGWIRNKDFHSLLPHGLAAEVGVDGGMSDNEWNVVENLMALRYRSGTEDAYISKYLFGEVPMLSSRPSTDIGRFKKFRDEYPGILKSAVCCFRFNGN